VGLADSGVSDFSQDHPISALLRQRTGGSVRVGY
jgi:hypothetical protein